MIAFLTVLVLQGGIVTGTVRDAITGVPVFSAMIIGPGARTLSDERGRFSLQARRGDTLQVRRIGYRTGTVVAHTPRLSILLSPTVVRLSELEVRGRRSVARLAVTRDVSPSALGSVSSLSEVLARTPFVAARSSRAGLALSMRGSRPEQVLVTLDGVPLNDPATGLADVADIPLVALGAVRVVPGSAAATAGSGASGGVLSLHTATGSSARAFAGSFGRVGLSGAHALEVQGTTIRIGGEWTSARNDFPFVNTEGARDTAERRVNNDEERAGLFASALLPFAQVTLLATRAERGLVGPMNVRALDAARGLTRRALLRVATSPSNWNVAGGVRLLDFEYHDPRATSTRTRSLSGDVTVGRSLPWFSVSLGTGFDRVRSAELSESHRPRAFVAAEREGERDRWRFAVAARADAIRDAGVHISPSLALERRGRFTLFARAAQAFRAPTFYDLYLATPQWADAPRLLEPERVTLDAEAGLRTSPGPVSLSMSIFERRTRDAIVWFPGTFDWSPRNVARERVRVVEGRAEVLGTVLDVEVWAAWRRTRLSVDETVIPTPYVPYADAGAAARARLGSLTLHATLNVIGRRPFVSIPDPPADKELPAVALLDLDASWSLRPFGEHALLTVGMRNAGDARWESVARYPSAGRTWAVTFALLP